MAAVHEMMVDLHAVGAIDKQTMRDFDQVCLMPVEDLSAEEIRAIREGEQASQAVFANYLMPVEERTGPTQSRTSEMPEGNTG